MSIKLYELTKAYQEVERLMEEGGDWEEALNTIAEQFDEKVDSVAKAIRSYEAEAKAYKEEAEILISKARTAANKMDRLEDYLLRQMIAVGKDKVDGLFKVSVRLNPPSVVVVDEGAIPADFLRHIPESWEPDKKAIMDKWREGGKDFNAPPCAGVIIQEGQKRLEIK